MRDLPFVSLLHVEPTWPDVPRVPVEEALRPRLAAAGGMLAAQAEALGPSQPGFVELVRSERLLRDWLRRGIPRRAPPDAVNGLLSALQQAGLSDVAGELGRNVQPSAPTADRITVRLPPPLEATLTPIFAPPAEQLLLARQHLDSYDRWYAGYSDLQPILPSRHAALTGLPRFLNGRLAAIPSDLEPAAWLKTADDWLFSPTDASVPAPASCLFGVDDAAAARQQFVFLDAVMIPESRVAAAGPRAATVHVRLQQMYDGRPVLGGRVIVHMAAGDPRCSASSAYLPIPSDQFKHCRLRSEEEAKALAWRDLVQHALNGGMDEAEALGGYLAALDRWLADDQSDLAADEWPEAVQGIGRALADLAHRSAWSDEAMAALAQLEKALADSDPAQAAGGRHVLHSLRSKLDDKQAVRWDEGQIVPYLPYLAGATDRTDSCFVLPFAGEYYLAYRVEILSQAHDRGWRVYVNADADDARCHLLGWPEPLMAHDIRIFLTSADALANADRPVNVQGIDLSFMTPCWHEDAVPAAPIWTLAELEQNPRGLDPALIRDAANVAYHADRFYRYFSALCTGQAISAMLEDRTRRPAYFTVKVGAAAGPDRSLSTGFLASPAAPTIVLQSADELQVGLRTVHRPASDPEVIYHELAHALMWLMNSEPFDLVASTTPFGRALVEGYANYYARACAVSAASDAADTPWARACYREEAFGDRFDLSSDSARDPAGNRLPVPNLYPLTAGPDPDAADPTTAQSLQKYSVGMVWARVLWELREHEQDPSLADRLALNSYFYMPGWLASFETAAEGILDQMLPVQAVQLAGQFGKRNILAGRGVQALALAGSDVLVGTDVGVRRSAAAAIAWGPWERFAAGEGAVALAHDPASGKTFAATERGIYAWDAGRSAWLEHGTWKTKLTQETPLCMAAAAGTVYVGTARGLYALSAAAPGGDWARWEGDQALQFLVRDVAVVRQAGAGGVDEDLAYVATLREARRRVLAVNEADPEGVQWGDAAGLVPQGQMAATTAVAIEGGKAYLGTMAAGIWRQEDLTDNASWVQIATAAGLNGTAVLTLRVRQTAAGLAVLVGTSAGLFLGRLAGGGWTWTEIALDGDPSAHEAITALLFLDDHTWLVGTANRGLWRMEEVGGQRTWTQYGDIGL